MPTDYSKYRASEEEIDTYYLTPFDIKGARAAAMARIDRTIKQLNNDRVRNQDDKDFETLENNGVSYTPTVNGIVVDLLDMDGQKGFHATRANLLEMLPLLKADIKAGEHDVKLQAALEGVEAPAATEAKSKKVAKEDKYPKHLRTDYDKLEPQQKRNLGLWWGKGRNPDQSSRAEHGDLPDAPYKLPEKS